LQFCLTCIFLTIIKYCHYIFITCTQNPEKNHNCSLKEAILIFYISKDCWNVWLVIIRLPESSISTIVKTMIFEWNWCKAFFFLQRNTRVIIFDNFCSVYLPVKVFKNKGHFKKEVRVMVLNTIFSNISDISQGSTLTVVRLPGASEMRLRASENGTQLVRSGKWKWFYDMFNSWRAKWLILNYSVLEVAANFT
jgi:hypothetical protein